MSLVNTTETQLEHHDQIMDMPTTVGTAIGHKHVNGKDTGEEAVLVFVTRKYARRTLMGKFSAEAILPHKLNGIAVDVIEVGDIVKHGYSQRIRPLQPGYSCGHAKVSAGTIGGFFRDRDGALVALSNCHVFANEGDASNGDPIFHPGSADSKNGEPWAVLKSFSPLVDGCQHDSAIAVVNQDYVKSGNVSVVYPKLNRAIAGFGTPAMGMSLQKCGRTTGYTVGKVLGLNGKFSVGYDVGQRQIAGCVVATAMSRPGDSGSCLLDMDMNAVALLFAGSDKVTLGNPMNIVREAYGLDLWPASLGSPDVTVTTGQWFSFKSMGAFAVIEGNEVKIASKANQHCYVEHACGERLLGISCRIDTGTDQGASWGPGIAFGHGGDLVKINVRHGGTFGAYHANQEYLGVGRIHPNKEYQLRFRFTTTSVVGEGKDARS